MHAGIFFAVLRVYIHAFFVDILVIQAGVGQGEAVYGPQMLGGMQSNNGMVPARPVEIILGGMSAFLDQRVVVTHAIDHLALFGARGDLGEGGDVVFNAVHLPDGRAVQVDLKKIDPALIGEMAVPVDETGQHGLALEVDDAGRSAFVKEPLTPCFRFAARKDDLSVQGGNDFSRVRRFQSGRLMEIFRNGIDFAAVIHRVGFHDRCVQLHPSSKEYRSSYRT